MFRCRELLPHIVYTFGYHRFSQTSSSDIFVADTANISPFFMTEHVEKDGKKRCNVIVNISTQEI